MPRVVHFEIPSPNPVATARFYEQVFAWRTQHWGDDSSYVLCFTGEGPGIDGAITSEGDRKGVVNIVEVASLEETQQRVEAAGGRVVRPAFPVPGVGRVSYCEDVAGNPFGILQPDPHPVVLRP